MPSGLGWTKDLRKESKWRIPSVDRGKKNFRGGGKGGNSSRKKRLRQEKKEIREAILALNDKNGPSLRKKGRTGLV